MLEFHQTLHDTYGICLWAALAIAVLVVLIIIACVFIFSDTLKKTVFDKKIKDHYYIDVFDGEDITGGNIR